MKISAIIISRNDNYGGHLNERATYAINSAINTYDEVIYVDWNSPTHSLLWDIKDNLQLKGNLKHFVIPPDAAKSLTNYNEHAQLCCEVLARNIGIRRATGDYIISTNIDIIHPKREDIESIINNSDNNTMFTLSRREVTWDIIKEFHGGEMNFQEWDKLRDYIYINSEERVQNEATVTGDNYSIINCCGDFQLASRHVWNTVKGFEEQMIHACYPDTNVQKKAVLNGFGLEAVFNVPLYHMSHAGMENDGSSPSKQKYNDPWEWVEFFEESRNNDDWGLGNTEIEFEII